jgi:signal transduction histidine kinase
MEAELVNDAGGDVTARKRWRGREAPLLILSWSIVGLVFATEEYIAAHAFGGTVSWRETVVYALPAWYLWALITPLMLVLARRFPIRRGNATYALLLHLTASALLSLLHTAATIAVLQWLEPALLNGATYQQALRHRLQFASQLDVVTYWVVIGIAHAVAFYRAQTERELQSARLSASLAEARLQVLRMELNPHFLFNTLNAISGFVYSDPRAADKMIARLGELLRLSLATRNEVTLAEELRLLECYVEIERVRFGDRLAVTTDISSDAMRAIVPSLILQPLVENSVRHGLQPSGTGGTVVVHATTDGEMVTITVDDDGAGWSPSHGAAGSEGTGSEDTGAEDTGSGVGLANTRARLFAMYEDRATLEISAREPRGTSVRIGFPLVTAHV